MKYNDIMVVDINYYVFFFEFLIVIGDLIEDFNFLMFIVMDLLKYDVQCKVVNLMVLFVNLVVLEVKICECVENIFDSLLVGEIFDWVDFVFIEFIM